ncbi:MAG: homoaconitate hydratase [Candidatus Paceibacteria bacterium]|jgi:homoaconitate hydratase
MTHDNTGAVIPKFKSIGATRMHDADQPIFTLDHDVQNTSEANLAKYKGIEEFAAEQGVRFHPAGRGIGHQVMCEEGFVLPGTMVVASDSHSNIYGGLGALGTPVVRTDAAALWATGKTWYQVPKITRVVLTGQLKPGVSGKDVIITLCGRFNQDEVLNHGLEFVGDGVATLSIDERLTIANMTTEWGALVGVFPCDSKTVDWLEARLKRLEDQGQNRGDLNQGVIDSLRSHPLAADEGAYYSQTIQFDLGAVRPSVSGPDNVKVMRSVAEYEEEELPIQKAYLLSCVNGRADDLSAAARVVESKHIADTVELLVAAASTEVEEEVKRRGDWEILEAAGATFHLRGVDHASD